MQNATTVSGKVERSGHARAGNVHLLTLRIENGVLNRCVPPRNASKHQSAVQHGKNLARCRARFVHSAQRSYRQSSIKRGRQALA